MQNAERKQQIYKVARSCRAMSEVFKDLLYARTTLEYTSAIQDANPANEADIAPQLVVASESAGNLLPLQQLIMLHGESCVLKPNFKVSRCCAEETIITCSRTWADWHFLIAIAVFQDVGRGSREKMNLPCEPLPAYSTFHCLF
jgi:hypothetical protein